MVAVVYGLIVALIAVAGGFTTLGVIAVRRADAAADARIGEMKAEALAEKNAGARDTALDQLRLEVANHKTTKAEVAVLRDTVAKQGKALDEAGKEDPALLVARANASAAADGGVPLPVSEDAAGRDRREDPTVPVGKRPA